MAVQRFGKGRGQQSKAASPICQIKEPLRDGAEVGTALGSAVYTRVMVLCPTVLAALAGPVLGVQRAKKDIISQPALQV